MNVAAVYASNGQHPVYSRLRRTTAGMSVRRIIPVRPTILGILGMPVRRAGPLRPTLLGIRGMMPVRRVTEVHPTYWAYGA